MARRLSYLFVLILVVVFLDGLVHIAVVAPWLGALLIAVIASWLVIMTRAVETDFYGRSR